MNNHLRSTEAHVTFRHGTTHKITPRNVGRSWHQSIRQFRYSAWREWLRDTLHASPSTVEHLFPSD